MPAAVAVAASGGRDSTALLHATARAAREMGLQVHALHVHHGLVASADEWLARLRAQCARWSHTGLPLNFHATRLGGAPAVGESVEAWARRERYRALGTLARAAACDIVLLAHHRRDQAETLLLQALRGGGPAGLAAMPASVLRDGITWARPWLGLPREAVEAYVRRHRLSHVHDESNDDERFARNRLRRQVWPSLLAAFPDAEHQLCAAAARASEAAAVLAEVAAADVADCVAERALQVDRWGGLSAARKPGALRMGLRAMLSGVAAPESLVQRLLDELPQASAARWPAPGGELRLHDGVLRFETPPFVSADAPAMSCDLSQPGRHEPAGWRGVFVVSTVKSGGLSCARLRTAALRQREGGETFCFAPCAMPRSLKKQFQKLRVPAWRRDGPLVFDGSTLLFVPGLGMDSRALAAQGEPQVSLRWEPQSPA